VREGLPRGLPAVTGWIVAAVAWAMVCVGVRHVALGMGLEMEELVAKRHELLSRVQALETAVAGARQYEKLERMAVAGGYVKPGPGQVVVAGSGAETGLLGRLSGWFGGDSTTSYEGTADIRTRDQVVSKSPSPKWKKKTPRGGRGGKAARRR
jgi:hypothetical protein